MHKLLVAVQSSFRNSEYDHVLKITEDVDELHPNLSEICLYRLASLIELHQFSDAFNFLNSFDNQALANERWLVFLKVKLFTERGDLSLAKLTILNYVQKYPVDLEAVDLLLKISARDKDFEMLSNLAHLRYESRSLLIEAPKEYTAIVIQCYVKVDTLKLLFEDVLKALPFGNFKLIIVQDLPSNEKLLDKSLLVDNLIVSYLNKFSAKFDDVRYLKNTKNFGTSLTCLKALNAAYDDRSISNVIFFEDDCRVSANAFNWFSFAFCELLNDDVPFVGGESIFFNDLEFSGNEFIERISKSNMLSMYEDSYIYVDFVPSTCFAFKSSSWPAYYKYRGMPEGPESLNSYLFSLSKKCVMPVVPRVNDHGMMHVDGYSVAVLSGAVKEVKNYYLLSSSLVSHFVEFKEDKDDFFMATCKFSEPLLSKFFDV